MGCLWCGKYNRQCKTMQSRSPLFIKVTGLKCSYRKIFSPLTAMPVRKTEISGTEQARPLIRTHRKFHKGFWGTARSLKPGSCEEALSKGVAEKNKFSNWLVIDPKILLGFLALLAKKGEESIWTKWSTLRARNASDCWPGARDHGKEEEETRLFSLSRLPLRAIFRWVRERRLGTRQTQASFWALSLVSTAWRLRHGLPSYHFQWRHGL